MGIIKRISLLLFGLLSGMVGLISIGTSILLMVASFKFFDIEHLDDLIFDVIFAFAFTEVFMAFGITASLFGLCRIFGRRDWIMRIIDHYWSKAIKIGLALPLIAFVCVAIVKMVR